MSDYSHQPHPQPRRKRGPVSLWRLMEKRIPWYVAAVGFVTILLMGWVLAGQYDRGINSLHLILEDTKDQVFEREREILALNEQIRLADTDQFIAREARSKYGYLFPGEIRFVVTNPEVLGLPPRTDNAAPDGSASPDLFLPPDAGGQEQTEPEPVQGFTPAQPGEPGSTQDSGNGIIVPENWVVDVFIPPAATPAP